MYLDVATRVREDELRGDARIPHDDTAAGTIRTEDRPLKHRRLYLHVSTPRGDLVQDAVADGDQSRTRADPDAPSDRIELDILEDQ